MGHPLHEKSQQQHLGLRAFTILYVSPVLHIPLQPARVINSINQMTRETKEIQLAQTSRGKKNPNPNSANPSARDGIKTVANLATISLLTTLFIVKTRPPLTVFITGHLPLP